MFLLVHNPFKNSLFILTKKYKDIYSKKISNTFFWIPLPKIRDLTAMKFDRFLFSVYYTELFLRKSGSFVQPIGSGRWVHPAWNILHRLSERLTPLAIKGAKLMDPIKFISNLFTTGMFQEWFQEGPQLSSRDAERSQSLGRLYLWLL